MNTPHIPERFLHKIWQHQRFNAANLHASDGRKVEILFPGTPNTDGGPDFTAARIRIGNITFYGDVDFTRTLKHGNPTSTSLTITIIESSFMWS